MLFYGPSGDNGVGVGDDGVPGPAAELSVGDATGVSVGDATGVSVGDATGVSVGDATGVSVGDATGVSVGDATGVSVGDSVTISVGVNVEVPKGLPSISSLQEVKNKEHTRTVLITKATNLIFFIILPPSFIFTYITFCI